MGVIVFSNSSNGGNVDSPSAEYKCTQKCTFCITTVKKVVCSEPYSEESAEFEKGRQLKKYVNEGLIIPDEKLKQGFNLDQFGQKYFNCEMMIKKVEQIQEASQKMCVVKTAKYEGANSGKRGPANSSSKKSSAKKN